MIVACACDLYVLVCVNFEDEILLRREECKTQVNLNFFKKNINCRYGTGYKLEIFLGFG